MPSGALAFTHFPHLAKVFPLRDGTKIIDVGYFGKVNLHQFSSTEKTENPAKGNNNLKLLL